MALSLIKIRFCNEYIKHLNGARAARDAGYSVKTASSKANQLLKEPEVKAFVQELMDDRAMRTQITQDRVLQELARLAFVDPRAIMNVDENGNLVVTPTKELSPDDAACITEISQTITEKGGSLKVKLSDKRGALQDIGRHLKLFTDVNENKHTFNQMPTIKANIETGEDGSEKLKSVSLDFDIGDDVKAQPQEEE